ncbi:MAG: hypothetical protein CL543_00200 [Alcanivorax sp.]|nr:hypothetical protein [Alcanivorax sp.]
MTRERDVKLGDIDDVPVDEPRRRPAGEQPRPPKSGGGGNGGGNGNNKGGGRRPAPRQPEPRSGSGGGGWVFLTLVLAVVLAVACTYFYREISRLQGQMETRMGMSSEQLENLQARLSATDESLDQSAGKLRDTLSQHGKAIDTNGDEIRKLWDVSNKRNKEWIQENQKTLDSVEKALKSNQNALAELKKTVGGYDQSIKQVRGQIDELQSKVASAIEAVNDSSDQWRTQINQVETQVDVVVDTVKQLEQQNQTQKQAIASLRSNQSGAAQLDQRLSEIEDAIRAFDQYRLQVNNRLDSLER